MTSQELTRRSLIAAEVCRLCNCTEDEVRIVHQQANALRDPDAFGVPLRDHLVRIVVMNLRDHLGRAEANHRSDAVE